MPTLPKAACPVCRRVGCTDPAHKRAMFQSDVPQRVRRPYDSKERRRRKAAVDAWREEYGDWCPLCGRHGVKLSADHITPYAETGTEDTPLRVICLDCNRRLGSQLGGQRAHK
jgi:hypothetical protein